MQTFQNFLKIGLTIKHYTLLAKIGEGGMGIVFKAQDHKCHRIVAIKFMLHPTMIRSLKRFEQEILITASFNHNNIIKVYEHGIFNQLPYIVMEYIDGVPLLQSFKIHKPSLNEKLLILKKIADTLHYAHSKKILHRDIKPSNIMIRSTGEPVILDFGLAKNITKCNKLTKTGEMVGTLQYMAPEQAEGIRKSVSISSDVYSLGAILYEILTEEPIYNGTPIEILGKIARGKFVSPRAIKKEISKALEHICLKSIEYKPEKRYKTAKSFALDISLYLSNKKTKSSAYYRKRMVLFSLKMMTLIAIMIFSLYFFYNNKQEEILEHSEYMTKMFHRIANRHNINQKEIQKEWKNFSIKKKSFHAILQYASHLSGGYHFLDNYYLVCNYIFREEYQNAIVQLAQLEILFKNLGGISFHKRKIHNALVRLAVLLDFKMKEYEKVIKYRSDIFYQQDFKMMQGYSYYKLQQFQKAYTIFAPFKTAKAYYYKGNIDVLQKRYGAAIKNYEMALELDTKIQHQIKLRYCSAYLHCNKKNIRNEIRKKKVSIYLKKDLAKVYKEKKEYRAVLALFYVKLAQNANNNITRKYARKAIQILREIKKTDRDGDLFDLQGIAYFLDKNYTKAQEYFTKAIKLNPNKIQSIDIRVKTLFYSNTPWYLHDYENYIFMIMLKGERSI